MENYRITRLRKKVNIRSIEPQKNSLKISKLLILGEIELRNDKETDGFNSKYFGDIHFQQNGDPVLIIGHHTMTGKVVKVFLSGTPKLKRIILNFTLKRCR